ncbi:MAG: Unknown protein [uncultured Sulfurovum sp.]|uniref:DUF1853 domain-containing protein n=1 Tax=uncultured Sulfurovum sp. TaxID=269237 RepID=A0A6S6TIN4_9BACT|nr:MAG: Unknown protein [uncultured Sulfurovum sp.]
MKSNKTPFKNQDKRLYYQYLGFINSVNLFTQDIMGMKHFNFEAQSISYEDFQTFSLDVQVPLGKRVERFFEFYIQENPNYKMLKKNIQINHNKTTIGEFDFFLEEQNNKKVIHVELVYKFYIYKEHTDEIKRYHGPNNHDNLEDKLHKLQTRQFPLLYNPYAKEILKELDISKVSQELCFLGNVFVKQETEANFEVINPNALAGTYLSFETFLTDARYKNKHYFIPQKEDWLVEEKYAEFWYKHEETIEKIEKYFQRNISLLLWIKSGNEFEKAFVLKSSP